MKTIADIWQWVKSFHLWGGNYVRDDHKTHMWGEERLSADHKTMERECIMCHVHQYRYSEFWLQHRNWDADKVWIAHA